MDSWEHSHERKHGENHVGVHPGSEIINTEKEVFGGV